LEEQVSWQEGSSSSARGSLDALDSLDARLADPRSWSALLELGISVDCRSVTPGESRFASSSERSDASLQPQPTHTASHNPAPVLFTAADHALGITQLPSLSSHRRRAHSARPGSLRSIARAMRAGAFCVHKAAWKLH
jgi:hypothetical protein